MALGVMIQQKEKMLLSGYCCLALKNHEIFERCRLELELDIDMDMGVCSDYNIVVPSTAGCMGKHHPFHSANIVTVEECWPSDDSAWDTDKLLSFVHLVKDKN